ncbi:unnamed protein product [Blepharisma stoltei]|uniref:Uncharacterized protein n=1 Tax=Blepharisma stoltei TaxID=1481888 RepID=A0AAU9IIM7_9CILI|nr:unnamed protein product [Blepharisma stoltei]
MMFKKLKPISERCCDEYLAQKILNDIRNLKKIDSIQASYLNKLELINFPNIYTLFSKYLDKTLKEDLLNLVLLSRLSKEIDLACSNAITILAKSDFSFKNIDLSNIRIPKADLSQCLFINVNFENSNLKEVNFLQSHITSGGRHVGTFGRKHCDSWDYECLMRGTPLAPVCARSVREKTWAGLTRKGKGLSFSDDDNYFCYRNDNNLIELDLKNQESKIKANFTNFVSSHITKCLNAELKPVTLKTRNQFIEFWDEHENRLLFYIDPFNLKFSPNYKYIVAYDNNIFIRCWDIENNHQIIDPFNKFDHKWTQFAFAPSSKYLAIKSPDTIYIIETKNWTLIRFLRGRFSLKGVIAISSCETKIACSSSGIHLIDVSSSDQSKIFFKNKKIRALTFSLCGKFLAFGSNKGVGYMMNLENQRILQVFAGFKDKLTSVLLSMSSKYISLTNWYGEIWVYEFFPKFVKNGKNFQKAKVSPKGTYLLFFNQKKSILWDLTDFNPKQIKQLSFSAFYLNFAFSPFDTYLVQRIYHHFDIYHIKRDMWLKTLTLGYFCHFTFSNCESYFICLRNDIYEYFTIPYLDKVKIAETKTLDYYHYAFTKCGKYSIWIGSQFCICIWDLEKDCFIKSIQREKGATIFTFTSTLSKFAFLFPSKPKPYIKVLNIDTNDSVCIESREEITCFCFSPNGREIIGGNENGIINIWDVETWTVKEKIRSLFLRSIKSVEDVNGLIIIREKQNIEIYKAAQLD